MAQVKLRNNWFSPNGKRYKVGVHEFEDSLLPFLPPSAEILSAPVAPEPEPVVTKHVPAAKSKSIDL